MTLNEITAAMQKWNAQRNQGGLNTIEGWLSTGNSFNYTLQQNVPNEELHVYMGVTTTNEVVCLVIPKENDTAAKVGSVPPGQPNSYVEVCPIKLGYPNQRSNGGMPTQEALNRISAWSNSTTRDGWVSSNITNLFRAFKVPKGDFITGDSYTVFFALRPDLRASGDAYAELIVEDIDSRNVTTYMDTTMPVPPFPANDLYLMTL